MIGLARLALSIRGCVERENALCVHPDRCGVFGDDGHESSDELVGFIVLHEMMCQQTRRLGRVVTSETAATKMFDDLIEVEIIVFKRWRVAPFDRGQMSVRL